jgi:hypothetical protein
MLEYAMLEDAYPNVIKKQTKKKICEKFGPDYTETDCCYYDKQGLKMPCCEKFTNPSNPSTPATSSTPATPSIPSTSASIPSTSASTPSASASTPPPKTPVSAPSTIPNSSQPIYAFDSYDTNTYINGYNDNGYDAYVNINLSKNKENDNENDKDKGNVKCSPLQVPEYRLPVDNKSKNAFNKALETSLKDTGTVNIDKFTIRPYDFDEYSAYTNVINVNTNNKDQSLEYRTTPFLEEYLISLRDNFGKPIKEQGLKIENIEQFTNYSKNLKVDVNLYNLFLFIFIGIVIILLCEQITRLAIIIANKNI